MLSLANRYRYVVFQLTLPKGSWLIWMRLLTFGFEERVICSCSRRSQHLSNWLRFADEQGSLEYLPSLGLKFFAEYIIVVQTSDFSSRIEGGFRWGLF